MFRYKYLTIALSMFLLLGCESYNHATGQQGHTPSIVGDIVDNDTWYQDESTVVEDMNVTIPVPNSSLCADANNPNGPLRPCTLQDVDADSDPWDNYEPTLNVKFFTKDFIPSSEQTNASFKQKGKSTRQAAQKSYKVKLDSKTNLYRGERRIQFNKQYYDFTRVRNKLSFDLFQNIPNLTSLKTEFVNLHIDSVDYGLYTRVESCDKEYLSNHHFGRKDNLYKAQNFNFRMNDKLKLGSDGKPLDPKAFDTILTIENGKKQTKLIEMIDAVNERHADIDNVVGKYFNRNNYLTWLAVNIIVSNFDTTSQNFFLLNPKYSDTFYFLPWDYDDAWGWDRQFHEPSNLPRWGKSISRWWDSPLHSKFFMVQKNRDDLDAMIHHLFDTYFTKAIIEQKVAEYKRLARPYVMNSPDFDELPLPFNDNNATRIEQLWDDECAILYNRIVENMNDYERLKGMPMPFWQDASYSNNHLKLEWDESVDLEGDEIVYDVDFSQDVDFNTTIISYRDYNSTVVDRNITLNPGTYFLRVIAKEKLNPQHYQYAFDEYDDSNDNTHFGLYEFEVK